MKAASKAAAVCIIENENGEILFLERTSLPFGFGLVGGKVDEGENPQQACTREIIEETNITITDDNLEYIGMVPSSTGKYMMYVFKTKLDHTPEVTLSDEHTDYEWVKDVSNFDMAGHTDQMIMMYNLSNMTNFTEE